MGNENEDKNNKENKKGSKEMKKKKKKRSKANNKEEQGKKDKKHKKKSKTDKKKEKKDKKDKVEEKGKEKKHKKEKKPKKKASKAKVKPKSAGKQQPQPQPPSPKGPAPAPAHAYTGTPEQIGKNKLLLDKICAFLESTKPDEVTPKTKNDLDKIQQLIKNISFRDNGAPERVIEVALTEKQKAVILEITGLVCDDTDNIPMTVNADTDGKTSGAKGERLDFVQTKT